MIHDSRYVHFEELVEVCLRHLRLQGERSFASTGASTSKCNPKNIFDTVDGLLKDQLALEKQIAKSQEIIRRFKTDKSSKIASSVLLNNL